MSSAQKTFVEPVPQKTTVALINLVVLRFSDFLNKFYTETEEKLMTLEKRIDNLDTVLVLLEKKLDSVPAEIFNSIPVQTYNNAAPAQPEASSQSVAAAEQNSQPPGASAEVQQQQQPQAAQPDAQPAPAPEDDPAREEYVRYIKMHKMGVPLPAIRIKMQAEGVDPDGLEKYLPVDA